MAATLSQPAFGLQAPANDDTMEISSDFGAMDGDIDIDLDSAGEVMHYEDDDQMIDDVKSDAGSLHDDDVMLDGDTASNAGDREMHDDGLPFPPQERDEELLDFSEDEDIYADEAPVAESAPPVVGAPVEEAASVAEEPVEQVQSETAAELVTEGVEVHDHIAKQDEPDQTAQLTILPEDQEQLEATEEDHLFDISGHEEAATSVHTSEHDATQNNEHTQTSTEDEQVQQEVTPSIEDPPLQVAQTHQQPSGDSPSEQSAEAADETNNESNVPNTESDQAAAPPVALTVDTESAEHGNTDVTSPRTERPASPTITGLHPTVVEYQNNEIYLFPSREPTVSEQYLLSNENLVTTSLGDLLQACRSVLGESLSEDEELVLGVEELDLYVSEDSTPAFSTSFSELLDVYLQLHKHDGNDHPPPFRVTLTTKTRFTNRLTLITQAIAEGKGYSQLPFLLEPAFEEDLTGFPEEEDFDSDDYHQDDYQKDEEYLAVDQEQQQETQQPTTDSLDTQHGEGSNEQRQEEEGSIHYQDYDQVSYDVEQPQDIAEPAKPVESMDKGGDCSQAEEAQDETQYYDAVGDGYYEDVDGQDHHNDLSADNDVPTGPYAEDNILDFGDDEYDSLTSAKSSAEAGLVETQLDDLTAKTATSSKEGELGGEPQLGGVEHDEEATYAGKQHQSEDSAQGEIYEDGDALADEAESATVNDAGEPEVAVAGEPTYERHADAPRHDEAQQAAEDYIDLGEDLSGNGTNDRSEGLPINDHPRDEADTTVNGNGVIPEHDPDVIDFDDDEDFDDEQSPSRASLQPESAKGSPSIKRSYSERDELEEVGEDGQALKKVRSS